ncbi:MAG TPA: hypothetical protein VL527_15205 [Dongiaceae bacterium]|nr:hypothetical protein [Dongiaceae bacterium]
MKKDAGSFCILHSAFSLLPSFPPGPEAGSGCIFRIPAGILTEFPNPCGLMVNPIFGGKKRGIKNLNRLRENGLQNWQIEKLQNQC